MKKPDKEKAVELVRRSGNNTLLRARSLGTRRKTLNGRFKLTRLVKTMTSEIYLIWENERRLGQLDLHYAQDTIHATLVLEEDLTVNEEEELLRQIDEDLVTSYLPSFEREDFLVTVFRGEEISSYADSSAGLEDEEDEDEE